MKNNLEKALQGLIVFTCLILLSARWYSPVSHAQIACKGKPEIRPYHHLVSPYYALEGNRWPYGSQVPVKILDYEEYGFEFNSINEGILEWNTHTDCSNIHFLFATSGANNPPTEFPDVPTGELWVIRSDLGTQAFPLQDRLFHMIAGYIRVHSPTNFVALKSVLSHESGHLFGFLDANVGDPTIMGTYLSGEVPTACDEAAIRKVYCPPPPPRPTPTPPLVGFCNGPTYPDGTCSSGFVANGGVCVRSQAFIQNCEQNGPYDPDSCLCQGSCDPFCSPIVVDTLGNGFSMTNPANGVNFDLNNDGVSERLSWISNGSDDAWLALDRNYDGVIDGGKELFGNVSPQEPVGPGEEMNGFRALAVFDQVGYGGNGDGKITQQDTVFERLKLWQDTNHNGVSESCELFGLRDLGLRTIDLDYVESQRIDAYGNQFKYRSRVRDANNAQLGRWAWDVFLVVQQP